MSEFNDTAQTSSAAAAAAGYPYTSLTSQYTPATTVAISLRQFEKDAKTQAEREYDAHNGELPEPPAEDDTSMPPAELQRLKKRRKVRSAIVSRRKSAIYLEKLEHELDLKDSINAQMKTKMGVFADVLRETEQRIDNLTHYLGHPPASQQHHPAPHPAHAGAPVPKRRRTLPDLPPQPQHSMPLTAPQAAPQHPAGQQPPQPQHAQTGPHGPGHLGLAAAQPAPQMGAGAGEFFLEGAAIDDILSISAEDFGAGGGYGTTTTQHSGVTMSGVRDTDESPSGQSSPVTPRMGRFEGARAGAGGEFPRICLTDSIWRPGAGGFSYRDGRTL